MAISIDWATRVITVPQADLTPVSGSLYELDVDSFRLALKDIEDSEDGSVFPDTHSHNTEVTLSGVTYARLVQIINGYTVTFEDVGSPYRVRCVGANHNISDVQNLNDVSLIVGNAAGLIVVTSGSGLSAAQDQALTDARDHALEARRLLRNKRVLDPATGIETVYDDAGVALFTRNVYVDKDGTTPYDGTQAPHRVERYA